MQEYVYHFGVGQATMQNGIYAASSAYVSKPYKIDGNISRVSLTAYENHPVLTSDSNIISDRCTSVEYYVSNMEYVPPESWRPILPIGSDVRCELLFFDMSGTAKLRFKAVPTSCIVYKDGVRISQDSFVCTNNSIIITKNYDSSSEYTVDYKPVNGYYIDFDNNMTTEYDEVFDGTDRNMTVTLKYCPTDAVIVYLEDTDILGPNKQVLKTIGPDGDVITRNVTDFYSGKDVELQPYSINHPIFEFKQNGNKLYFTETFNKADLKQNMEITHGNAKIHAYYKYTSSILRVKIILRRLNNPIGTNGSPSVTEYRLDVVV